MEASVNLTLKQSFILKPEHLELLWAELNKNVGSTTASIYCEDQINRMYDTCESILQYSNPSSARIQSISLRSKSDDYCKSARIMFSNDNYGTIRLEADGSEDTIINLKDCLLNTISRCKSWYDRFARLDIFNLMFFIATGSFVLLALLVAFGIFSSEKPAQSSVNPRDVTIAMLIVAGFIGALAFISLLLSKLRNKLFPIGIFFWGDAVDQHHFLEKIRWTILIGFFVSLLAGIVGAILLNFA